jgi:hypothetical protein
MVGAMGSHGWLLLYLVITPPGLQQLASTPLPGCTATELRAGIAHACWLLEGGDISCTVLRSCFGCCVSIPAVCQCTLGWMPVPNGTAQGTLGCTVWNRTSWNVVRLQGCLKTT